MFWLIAAFLSLIAIAIAIFPLLRRGGNDGPEHYALNAAVLESQRRELEQDLAEGVIDVEQHRQASDELAREARIAQTAEANTTEVRRGRSMLAAGLIAVTIPLVAVAVYQQVGSEVKDNPPHHSQAMTEMPDIDALIARLQRRLESNPDDPEGWAMLARSLDSMGRSDEALGALDAAFGSGVESADLYLSYADLLAGQHGTLAGEPARYIDKALALEPNNPDALWLAGSAALERKEPKKAIKHWERLQALLEPGSEEASIVMENLHMVRQGMASKR